MMWLLRCRLCFFFVCNIQALILNTVPSFRVKHVNELACLAIIFCSLSVNSVYGVFLNTILAHLHSNIQAEDQRTAVLNCEGWSDVPR